MPQARRSEPSSVSSNRSAKLTASGPTCLRLHIHPGTSGLAPHMALLATGVAFEVRTLDLFAGEARTPAFLALNPFGTVPVLEDGDAVIPETGAILLHVAERFPAAGLLPEDAKARAQALRWLFHVAALHADFMTWRRANFALRDDQHAMEATQAWMARRLAEAFRTVDQVMAGPFLAGSGPGPADFYLVMVAGWWRRRFDFSMETPRLAGFLQTMIDSPNVRGAYKAQGSDLPRFRDVAPVVA